MCRDGPLVLRIDVGVFRGAHSVFEEAGYEGAVRFAQEASCSFVKACRDANRELGRGP